MTLNTCGTSHLGIWSKPGAPFDCMEPGFGTGDFVDWDSDFESKPDLKTLAPEQAYVHGIAIGFSA